MYLFDSKTLQIFIMNTFNHSIYSIYLIIKYSNNLFI